MSERGSFCTEYVYCNKCFEVLKKHLLDKEKYLCGQTIESWQTDQELPIIAGKIGGLYAGEEIQTFRTELGPAIAKEICHPVSIAVLSDSGGSAIFNIAPKPSIKVDIETIEPIIEVSKNNVDLSTNIEWLSERARELGWVLRPFSQDMK